MASGESSVITDTRGLDILIDQSSTRLDRWLAGIAFGMQGDIVLSFNTSPPGRTYSHGGVTHVASISPYPPNVDTAALKASIDVTQVSRYEYWIHDGVEYGKYLEFGTETIAPRPFMIPVANEWIEIKIREAVRELDLTGGI